MVTHLMYLTAHKSGLYDIALFLRQEHPFENSEYENFDDLAESVEDYDSFDESDENSESMNEIDENSESMNESNEDL